MLKNLLESLGFKTDEKFSGLPYLLPEDGEAYPIVIISKDMTHIEVISLDYDEEGFPFEIMDKIKLPKGREAEYLLDYLS